MLKIYDVDTAQAGILNRDNALDVSVPEGLQKGIEGMFGERLTPEQVVRRILADVRQRGDTAVLEWTHRIDRVQRVLP